MYLDEPHRTTHLDLCEELGITSLEALSGILKRPEFRDKLRATYSAILPVPIGPETVLLAGLYAHAQDDARALEYVRNRAQEEWDEIESIGRREMLSELPASVEELIEDLEDPRHEIDIVSIAEVLGATKECAICSDSIVDPYGFAEAAIEHYELSGDRADQAFQRIEEAIWQSGVDMGGENDSSLCSYHANQAAKDD